MSQKISQKQGGNMKIKSISYLAFKCKYCKRRADFLVTLFNEDLPKKYIKMGERIETYCKKHLPKKIRKIWEEEICYNEK